VSTALSFRWLGVAGLELQAEGRILAIDPFFSRPPFWRLWLGRVTPDAALAAEMVPHCDYVLTTHAHFDHLMDVPAVAGHSGAVAYGSANACRLLAACDVAGDQIRQIEAGDELTLGPFRVEVLDARHLPVPGFSAGPLPSRLEPPLRLRDYRMDRCFSFRIEVGGLLLLNWHGVHPGPAPRADVLLAGPEGRRTFYEPLLAGVGPRLFIPLHWDNMFRPLTRPLRPFYEPPHLAWPPLRRTNPDCLGRMIEGIAPGTRVLVPKIFAVYDLAHTAQDQACSY
jgi:L-ascorbate metabolism protein UlaG (beta-lactamase superfamily)